MLKGAQTAARPVALERSPESFVCMLGQPRVRALHLPLRYLHPHVAGVEDNTLTSTIIEAAAAVGVDILAAPIAAFNSLQLRLMEM